MIEITGWTRVDIPSNSNLGDLEVIIEDLKRKIEPMSMLNSIFEIKSINGSYFLFIGLNHNHDNGYFIQVYNLLEFIATIATLSYGLVYYRDDEIKDSLNSFKVIRIKKGCIDIIDDNYLSPCEFMIED